MVFITFHYCTTGGIAPKIKNATIQGINKTTIIACQIYDFKLLIITAVKPNHELQYNIGTDFCVEDPMSSKFHSIITCQLEGDALPTPEFLWNITVNGTEFNSRDFHYENDNLSLTGPIKLDLTSTLSLDMYQTYLETIQQLPPSVSVVRQCSYCQLVQRHLVCWGRSCKISTRGVLL